MKNYYSPENECETGQTKHESFKQSALFYAKKDREIQTSKDQILRVTILHLGNQGSRGSLEIHCLQLGVAYSNSNRSGGCLTLIVGGPTVRSAKSSPSTWPIKWFCRVAISSNGKGLSCKLIEKLVEVGLLASSAERRRCVPTSSGEKANVSPACWVSTNVEASLEALVTDFGFGTG